MKNFGWFLVFAFFFAGCKKDYECECVTRDSTGATIGTAVYPIHATKVKAKSECDKNAQNSILGSTTSKSCTIK